ncbi:hypothetical protein PENSPDRAFT_362066 [Peniophora sp. CONT]|nr:hypothetical protein PENSPDRAFT_362066 [Peniophora sp. CONT]
MPCEPFLRCASHEIRTATDEAPRAQTLDAMLDDLKNELGSTPERRLVAPFLDCYQLCPRTAPCPSTSDSTALLVSSSPSTYLTHPDPNEPETQDLNRTRYCIIEHNGPASATMPSRRVPLYDPCADGAVTLWRIPTKSPGLFFGNVDSHMFGKEGNPRLYELFYQLRYALNSRGLPSRYTTENPNSVWVDPTEKRIRGSS